MYRGKKCEQKDENKCEITKQGCQKLSPMILFNIDNSAKITTPNVQLIKIKIVSFLPLKSLKSMWLDYTSTALAARFTDNIAITKLRSLSVTILDC